MEIDSKDFLWLFKPLPDEDFFVHSLTKRGKPESRMVGLRQDQLVITKLSGKLVLEFKKVVYDRPLRLETQLASKLCNELQLRFEICSAQSRALQLPQLQYNAEISSKNVFSSHRSGIEYETTQRLARELIEILHRFSRSLGKPILQAPDHVVALARLSKASTRRLQSPNKAKRSPHESSSTSREEKAGDSKVEPVAEDHPSPEGPLSAEASAPESSDTEHSNEGSQVVVGGKASTTPAHLPQEYHGTLWISSLGFPVGFPLKLRSMDEMGDAIPRSWLDRPDSGRERVSDFVVRLRRFTADWSELPGRGTEKELKAVLAADAVLQTLDTASSRVRAAVHMALVDATMPFGQEFLRDLKKCRQFRLAFNRARFEALNERRKARTQRAQSFVPAMAGEPKTPVRGRLQSSVEDRALATEPRHFKGTLSANDAVAEPNSGGGGSGAHQGIPESPNLEIKETEGQDTSSRSIQSSTSTRSSVMDLAWPARQSKRRKRSPMAAADAAAWAFIRHINGVITRFHDVLKTKMEQRLRYTYQDIVATANAQSLAGEGSSPVGRETSVSFAVPQRRKSGTGARTDRYASIAVPSGADAGRLSAHAGTGDALVFGTPLLDLVSVRGSEIATEEVGWWSFREVEESVLAHNYKGLQAAIAHLVSPEEEEILQRTIDTLKVQPPEYYEPPEPLPVETAAAAAALLREMENATFITDKLRYLGEAAKMIETATRVVVVPLAKFGSKIRHRHSQSGAWRWMSAVTQAVAASTGLCRQPQGPEIYLGHRGLTRELTESTLKAAAAPTEEEFTSGPRGGDDLVPGLLYVLVQANLRRPLLQLALLKHGAPSSCLQYCPGRGYFVVTFEVALRYLLDLGLGFQSE